MFRSGGYEDDTSRTDLSVLRPHGDSSAAADDEIDLVLGMRRLRVRPTPREFVEAAAHRRCPEELQVGLAAASARFQQIGHFVSEHDPDRGNGPADKAPRAPHITVKYPGHLLAASMASDSPEEEQKKRQSPPPVEFLKPGEAQAPLPPRDQPAAWVPRPEDYQPPPAWTPPAGQGRGASNLPRIAGTLLAVSAILGMAGAIYNAVTLPSVADYANYTQNTSPALVAASQICGLISIWSQAMALLGGVMAYQRMNWKLTVVCAIFSLATLGFFLFEASLIGFLALIITIRARPFFIS